MERFTAEGANWSNKNWLVFDNEECYCVLGPTTQLNATDKARELNEKHAGKDEVSTLKTRIAELEAEVSAWSDLWDEAMNAVERCARKEAWHGGHPLLVFQHTKALKEQGDE